MKAEAGPTVSSRPSQAPRPSRPYRRSVRNLLLQPRFQLKYTAMVVGVTVFVAGTLGAFAYKYSRGQTELLAIHRMEAAIDRGEDIGQQFTDDLQRYASAEDRKVLRFILLGILLLALALGGTGIVITHRLVGPAYRLKHLFASVRDGRWTVVRGLRKHDELQDVFEAYKEMLDSLRQMRLREVAALDDSLQKAEQAGAPEEVLSDIRGVRDRMRSVLE